MRIGAADARPILFIAPLFEEMNRTRAFLADVMRHLAALGHGCWLPDLPGTGESERSLEQVTWEEWRHGAVAAAAQVRAESGKTPAVAAIRGGALLDDAMAAECRWRLAPVDGASLARDMARSGLAGVEWAGYAAAPALRSALAEASPATLPGLRVVRLASDPAEADARIEGPALWRRSEPGRSAALAEAAAADLAQWIEQCAAS
jgi:pimeloyl-ACP methyl ester carboxylesterase